MNVQDNKSSSSLNRSVWLHLAGHITALAGVALTTAVIHAIPGADHVTNISLLYLLIVMATAYGFGSGPAVLAALLAVLSFDWFFVEPRYTLTADDPAEWLALSIFLVTAIVISQLTHTLRLRAQEARLRAEEARQRERETAALSRASWAVTSQVSHQRTLAEVLRQMTDVAGSEAAAIVTQAADGSVEVVACHEQQEACLPDFTSEEQRRILHAVRERSGVDSCMVGSGDQPTNTVVNTVFGQAANGAERMNATDATIIPEAAAIIPAAVYLPLVMEQRVLAVLYLRRRDHQALSDDSRRVVESLANHAAVALERHRLVQTEAQAKALVEADKMKTALLSMVSHDFRSPLAAIKASVSGLLQDGVPWDGKTQRELLTGIDQETDRLNRMVGDILALSRLEADAWRPQCELVSVAEVIGAALDAFSSDENRRIRVTLDAALPEAFLDSVQIVQVLHNLLENALKYSPAGSPVELSASRQHETQQHEILSIEVLDRGFGLPPEEAEHIFERFYRAARWRESSLPGSGIGLAICRGLVEAHGGHLTAANRAGGGAVFQVALPLHQGTIER